jgi:hypothetical protein
MRGVASRWWALGQGQDWVTDVAVVSMSLSLGECGCENES